MYDDDIYFLFDNSCEASCEGYDGPYSNPESYYFDNDGDGFGSADSAIISCYQPGGYVTDSTDCDDMDTNSNPDAIEICDGIDNNCDGQIDEGFPPMSVYYLDLDGDGYGAGEPINSCFPIIGYTPFNGDCDDLNLNVHPGQTDICDGIDNDCDGDIDEDDTPEYYYKDQDGDGYGNLDSLVISCSPIFGYVLNGDDCNDSNNEVYPFAFDKCDSLDNDCDGFIDEDEMPRKWYLDRDGDGYGDTSITVFACSPPTGFVPDSLDCNDDDPEVNPAAVEICDGIDNNCNGLIDGDDPTIDRDGLYIYFIDNDNDGFGNPEDTIYSCFEMDGHSTNNLDCDDNNPFINPEADEIEGNGIDENCDGVDVITSLMEIDNRVISIYPNPSQGYLLIETNQYIDLSFEIFSSDGKSMLNQTLNNRIDLTELSNGIYYLKIEAIQSHNYVVKKIILNK